MLKFSDPHHFRKTVAGACMMLAPIVLLVAMVIHPERRTDEGAQLGVIGGNSDAWITAHLLVLAAIVLMVPAVLGLMHMLREREVAFGHVGGGLALLGLIGLTGLVAVEVVAWQAVAGGADRAEMTALFERLADTTGFAIPFLVVPLAFGAGAFILGLGLYRARVVQSYHALLFALGAVALTVSGPVAIGWLAIVGAALLVVGLGSIGRYVLEETDSEWEATPEYRGFRPIAGMR